MIVVPLLWVQAPPTAQVFESAARALAAGDYPAAQRGFEEVLRREPANIGALGNLGVLYSRQDQPWKAVSVYERALKLAPGEPGLMLNLGLAYLKLDDFAHARPLFAKLAAQPGPRQAQVRELLAIAQLETGELAPAVASLEALAAASAPSPGVLHFLALGYVKQGKRDQAAAVIQRLYDSLPAPRAHYLEGRIWYDAALFEKALESFQKAAALEPALPGLALETGKTQISLRNAAEAERYLRAALAATPDSTEALYFLGALLVQNGKPEEGSPLLARVTQARPDLWGTYYYLGKAELSAGRAAVAVTLLEKAAQRAPTDTAVTYQLARALQASGRAADAKALFTKLKQNAAAAREEPLVRR